jgi:hypothetical protein
MKKLLILVMLLCCASAAHGAVTVSQIVTSTQTTNNVTVTLTPNASGDMLLVWFCTGSGFSGNTSDNVNAGNYVVVATSVNSGGAITNSCEWCYHLNVAASATTVTVATSGTDTSIVIYDLAGAATVSPIADHHEAQGTTTSGTTTSLTTSASGSALFAGFGDFNATSINAYIATAGSGWTSVTGNNVAAQCTGCQNVHYYPLGTEDQLSVGSGTFTVTATLSASGHWAGASVAIAPASVPSVPRHHQGTW